MEGVKRLLAFMPYFLYPFDVVFPFLFSRESRGGVNTQRGKGRERHEKAIKRLELEHQYEMNPEKRVLITEQ
jgi:hypothetical protein